MTIDVCLRFASNEAAYQRARAVAPWLAVAAVFVAAVLLRQVMPFNVDVSWLLIVSERMLDGQRLYVDIVEANPPMAVSVYLLGVALARAIGVRPEVATDGLIFLLIAASLALTWRILKYSSLRGRVGDGALAVWATGLLTVLPMYDFGQREHLALLAMLPAIGVYILRGNREPVTPAAVLIAALGAAITLSFKPYFAFAVGFCILTAAAQARDCTGELDRCRTRRGLRDLHLRFLSGVFYGHLSFGRDVYLLLKAPTLALFVSSATALWVGAVMIVLALQSQQRKLDAASFVLLAASFGFAIAFFVQRKGWGYQAYPMVALGLLAAGCAISAIDHGRTSSRRLGVAAMFAVLAMFANACMGFNAGVDVRQIEDQVARLGPHPRVLMLGAAAVIGHPMVRTLQGTWVSRQESLWVWGIVHRSRGDESIDPQTAARLEVYVARERAGLIEDFRKQPPDVILVDNQDSDWGSWAHADPELSALLKAYTPVQTIKGIDILQRTNEARS